MGRLKVGIPICQNDYRESRCSGDPGCIHKTHGMAEQFSDGSGHLGQLRAFTVGDLAAQLFAYCRLEH